MPEEDYDELDPNSDGAAPDETAIANPPMQEAPSGLVAANHPPSWLSGFGAPAGLATPGFSGAMPPVSASPLTSAAGIAPAIATQQAPQQQHPSFAQNHPRLQALLNVMSTLGDVGAGMAQPNGNLGSGFAYARQQQDQRQQNASILKIQQMKAQQDYLEKLAQQAEQKNKEALDVQKAQRDAMEKGFRPVVKGPQNVSVPDQANILDPSQSGYSTQTIPPPPVDPSRTVQIGNQSYEAPAPPPQQQPLVLPKAITDTLQMPEGYTAKDATDYRAFLTTAHSIAEAKKEDKPIPVQQQELDTAGLVEARKLGIQIDTNQPIMQQLPLDARVRAFSAAKDIGESSDAKAMHESTLATQGLTREMIKRNLLDKQAKAAAAQGPELSEAGKKNLQDIQTVSKQFDNLLDRLTPYKDNNNPTTLTVPLMKYKMGMNSPEGSLGNDISALSLASIQGMMPFASKSRSYQFIKDIGQHLPVLSGALPDSPQNIYSKLANARQNFLRMEASTMRYDTKHASANAAPPPLGPEQAQAYMKLTGGDKNKARELAVKDGWTIPGAGQ